MNSDQIMVLEGTFQSSSFLLGFVHAHVLHTMRRTLWNIIRSLPDKPKLVMGDFNAVLGAHERHSANPPIRIACQEFRDMIDDCELLEVVTAGNPYTWTNRRHFSNMVQSRIDRALCNHSFLDLWTTVHATTLVRNCSDHTPLKVACNPTIMSGPKVFRFRAMWTHHDGFMEVVKLSWEEPMTDSNPMCLVTRKLKRLKHRLKEWNHSVFGDVFRNLEDAQAQLEHIQNRGCRIF